MTDLLKEMVQTKERAAAWLFRILITLVGVSTSTVLWLAWASLQDVKAKSEQGVQLQWTAIGKINDAQQAASSALGVLTTKLDDHIKVEANIDDQLKDIAKDHEQRIRGLERPHS
jgi:orotate phosphoribosyltransferase-like protein